MHEKHAQVFKQTRQSISKKNYNIGKCQNRIDFPLKPILWIMGPNHSREHYMPLSIIDEYPGNNITV